MLVAISLFKTLPCTVEQSMHSRVWCSRGAKAKVSLQCMMFHSTRYCTDVQQRICAFNTINSVPAQWYDCAQELACNRMHAKMGLNRRLPVHIPAYNALGVASDVSAIAADKSRESKTWQFAKTASWINQIVAHNYARETSYFASSCFAQSFSLTDTSVCCKAAWQSSCPKQQQQSPVHVTAMLPFSLEELILGTQGDITKVVRAPAFSCAGCTPAISCAGCTPDIQP